MSDQFEILFDDPRVFSSETLLQGKYSVFRRYTDNTYLWKTSNFIRLSEIKSIMTDCSTKIDRLTMEVISIRIEVSVIKTKVYGRYQENAIEILEKPLNSLEDFIKLESSLEDEIVFKKFVSKFYDHHFVTTSINKNIYINFRNKN